MTLDVDYQLESFVKFKRTANSIQGGGDIGTHKSNKLNITFLHVVSGYDFG